MVRSLRLGGSHGGNGVPWIEAAVGPTDSMIKIRLCLPPALRSLVATITPAVPPPTMIASYLPAGASIALATPAHTPNCDPIPAASPACRNLRRLIDDITIFPLPPSGEPVSPASSQADIDFLRQSFCHHRRLCAGPLVDNLSRLSFR